ncbi:MAG: hypothetical protein Q9226_008601 [Calogaya cf. arnoldii]
MSLLVALLPLLPLALATPTPAGKPDQLSKLNPFSLPEIYTFSPSGRPGNSPYSTLNFTITDPNAKGKPTTKCSTQYINVAEIPTGEIPCEDPTFTFRITEPPSNGAFTLAITHTYVAKGSTTTTSGSVTVDNTTGFGVTCGGSGVCSGRLEGPPLEVPVTSVGYA